MVFFSIYHDRGKHPSAGFCRAGDLPFLSSNCHITLTATVTLTPTIRLTPTITLTPSITPLLPFRTRHPLTHPACPAGRGYTIYQPGDAQFHSLRSFSPLIFAQELDKDYQPVNPATTFKNPVGHYMPDLAMTRWSTACSGRLCGTARVRWSITRPSPGTAARAALVIQIGTRPHRMAARPLRSPDICWA